MVTIERRTYGQQAYAEIRTLIIDGTLAPGAKVVVRPLAERLQLSPTPIKSALAALERDGFLVAVPHRGYFVPEVSSGSVPARRPGCPAASRRRCASTRRSWPRWPTATRPGPSASPRRMFAGQRPLSRSRSGATGAEPAPTIWSEGLTIRDFESKISPVDHIGELP
jgi:DNA-binding transcriptional MocR family regulator